MMQDEMAYWLWHERGVRVSQSTISRLIKKNKWSRKELRRIALGQSDQLRQMYRQDMFGVAAEDIVFLDESIFNEKTCWRHKGYTPIGHPARYSDSINRGKTWSMVGAMTVNGLLPCSRGILESRDVCKLAVR
jgi:hypothetical protein